MAYTKTEWSCGDKITADKLNNIEDGIEEALQGDYECTETEVVFFNDSITTQNTGAGFAMGTFTPSQPINGDTLTVTMNGTEYELPKGDLDGHAFYGEVSGDTPVFTNYPCFVAPQGDSELFATENAGTYTVKMSGVTETVTTTSCFRKAVKSLSLEHILDGGADGSLRSNTSTPEGNGYVLGYSAVSLGLDTKASGHYSHAEGQGTTASGYYSHAEGDGTNASGDRSHAEGGTTTASGSYSHAEGSTTTASGEGSHAEGQGTTASGDGSHAEGNETTASKFASHAEGLFTTASGDHSHAEGSTTTASGESSHAEGRGTTASGSNSHAQNESTIAQGRSQTAIGKFNVAQGNATTANATDYAFIIGNGTGVNNRSNALAVKWDGTFVFADGTEITPAQFTALKALL